MTKTQRPYTEHDIAVWPDGGWAELGEVWDGHYHWKSDDYEIVREDDFDRLKALGLAENFGIP
ncbi:MAG: hypothetical protein J0I69_05135 [Altererythrobacter sp.]|nr:hypothetical protein [Altererythrobacter sp.]